MRKSPRAQEAADIVRRADNLQERSRQAAELQTKKEKHIKALKPGSASRARSEQRWPSGRRSAIACSPTRPPR